MPKQYTLAETAEMIITSAGITSKVATVIMIIFQYVEGISQWYLHPTWCRVCDSTITQVEYYSGGLCPWNSPLCWKLACCAQFLHCWRWSRAGGRGHTSSLSKLAPRSNPTENHLWESRSFLGSPLSEHWPLPHDTSLWALYHSPETKNAKNWHTRCARWCNDYNLNNQSWQPILT